MPKTYKTLIKLYKQHLDEKRKEMVILEESREKLVTKIKNLDQGVKQEIQFVNESSSPPFTLEQYLHKVNGQKDRSRKQIKVLDGHIALLSEQISEAFGELKKFEIMKDVKEADIKKEEQKNAQVELDEIGSVSYSRKQNKA